MSGRLNVAGLVLMYIRLRVIFPLSGTGLKMEIGIQRVIILVFRRLVIFVCMGVCVWVGFFFFQLGVGMTSLPRKIRLSQNASNGEAK